MTPPVVLKIGGRALEADGAVAELASEIAARPEPIVVVHGGGHEVSEWCTKLAIAPAFVDGLRVTDAATLDVVTAVLAGLANKRLVARLRAAGVDALGVSALDGGIVTAVPHPDHARLGAVGRVTGVDAARLRGWIAGGVTPVIASIAAHDGALLNVNADDLAAAIAGALSASVLVLLSDTPAVVLDGAPVSSLDPAGLDASLARADVTGGMRPKLRAAREAIDLGVGRVRIAAWSGAGTLASLLGSEPAGTTITAVAHGGRT